MVLLGSKAWGLHWLLLHARVLAKISVSNWVRTRVRSTIPSAVWEQHGF